MGTGQKRGFLGSGRKSVIFFAPDFRDVEFYNFSNFEIEEIATKRKIRYVRSDGEIIKDIQSIYISKGEKIIGFFYRYDKYTLFFDIQTGKELSEISYPNFFASDKY